MNAVLLETAEHLMLLADRLDGWAKQSRAGGWSTHQVEANESTAREIRARAAELYRLASATR